MKTLRTPADIPENEPVGIELEDNHVLICRQGDTYHAMSNICSHARVLLSMGKLRGNVITCPLHGARFDVTNGRCLSGPSKMDIPAYTVQRDGNELVITLPES